MYFNEIGEEVNKSRLSGGTFYEIYSISAELQGV